MSNTKKGLTKSQLEKIRADLLERQRWLLEGMKGVQTLEESDRGGDEADLATSSLNADMALDAKARETRELQMIEEALQKMQDGVYGVCEECGESIARLRLEALPFAGYCIACQERAEEEGSFAQSSQEFRMLD